MFFLRREARADPLFKDFNILKFHDKIALENCIFIHKSFKQQLPQPFDNRTELNYMEEILFVLN